MNYSYKRYWEPSTVQVLGLSLSVNAFSTALTYPMELVKTLSQVRTEAVGTRSKNLYMGINPHKVFREYHATGVGYKGFYAGFESHIVARLSYLFIRNLTYKMIYDTQKPVKAHNDLSYREKGVIAGISGALAALLTYPAELVNIRTVAQIGKPKEWRWNYTGLVDGLQRIAAEEGGKTGLFRGASSSVLRAIILNVSLTAPYDNFNERLFSTFGDMTWNKYFSLAWASLIGTVCTLPFDNIRTKIAAQNADPTKNRVVYRSITEAAQRTFHLEGWTGFYIGFNVFFARTYLYAFSTIFIMDKITSEIKRNAGLKEWQI